MLINKEDKKILTLPMVKGLCKLFKLKNYSILKKDELISKISIFHATRTIQRYFRKVLYKNAEDAITLEPVSYPCFMFKPKAGKIIFYSIDGLVRYIMKTGNTRDPCTRIQYSDSDLELLDNYAKRYLPGNRYKSTLKIKNNPDYANKIINRENQILSYQLRLDELKVSIRCIVEMGEIPDNEPVFIDGQNFISIRIYLDKLFNELRMILLNVCSIDSTVSVDYRKEFLEIFEGYGDRYLIDLRRLPF